MPQTQKKITDIHPETGQTYQEITAEKRLENPAIHPNRYPVWTTGDRSGAPTKCTGENITIVCDMIADGNYIETACTAAGISQDTFYHWRNLAKRDAEQGKNPGISGAPDESPFMLFSESVKRAFAIAEAGMIREMRYNRNGKDFQPLAWILERTRNDRYGQRQQVDVTHTVSGPDVPQQAPATHAQWLEQRNAERALLQAQAEDVAYTDVTEGEQDTGAS